MTKMEFLMALYDKLSCLPHEDAEERVSFYGEMIDDRMCEGLSEEEAVAEMGAADEIAAQIIADVPYVKLSPERPKAGRRMRAWEIVLLILGSPLWISILIAVFSVTISLIAALWSVVISIWSVFVSMVVGAFGGMAGGIALAFLGHAVTGCALTGAALVCGGLAVFMFFACREVSKGIFWVIKKTFLGVIRCFAGGKSV